MASAIFHILSLLAKLDCASESSEKRSSLLEELLKIVGENSLEILWVEVFLGTSAILA